MLITTKNSVRTTSNGIDTYTQKNQIREEKEKKNRINESKKN